MLHGASVHKPDVSPSALSRIGRRSGSWPVIVFALLSLAFGSAIVLANPPLRGPDEISHFLRIYSFTRGELLPAAEIDGRKGVFVERALYDRLYFFKNSGEWFATFLQQRKGEWFARTREEGVRYGRIMAEYRDTTRASGDEAAQAPVFAPFAGTEGYSPVAYAPYIIAAAVGRLLGLDLPELLFLMRFVGLVVFTAVTAYAIAVAPALKWAFVLIAMLPVSLYNRVVLSADGAALSYALVITALCFRAAWNPSAGRVWERSLWMTLCVLAKQPQIVFVLLELMAGRLRELPRRWSSLAIVVLPGVILSPLWVVEVRPTSRRGVSGRDTTIRRSSSIRCGSSLTCGSIHCISRWRHGLLSASGGPRCGRSSLASWGGRTFCFGPGPISCSRSSSCSCRCKRYRWTVQRVRAWRS